MPFTPLHFGPALAVREIVGHHRFGIWAFATTQVLFDIEPGIRMLLDLEGTLHQTTHNPLFGAFYLLLAALATWRWERGSAFIGAAFGVITHLWLDAMFHADVGTEMTKWGFPQSLTSSSTLADQICLAGFALWLFLASIRKLVEHRRLDASKKVSEPPVL